MIVKILITKKIKMKKWKDFNLFQKGFGIHGYGLILLIIAILILIEIFI